MAAPARARPGRGLDGGREARRSGAGAAARDPAVAPAARSTRPRTRTRSGSRRSSRSSCWTPGGRRRRTGVGQGAGSSASLRLKDDEQRQVLDAYLDALERGEIPEQRQSWAKPGWLAGVRTWVEAEAARLEPHRPRSRAGEALGHLVGAADRHRRPRSLLQGSGAAAVLRRRSDGDHAAGGAVPAAHPDAGCDRAEARLAPALAVRRAVPVPRAARRSPGGDAALRRSTAPERRADGGPAPRRLSTTGGSTSWRPRSTRSSKIRKQSLG